MNRLSVILDTVPGLDRQYKTRTWLAHHWFDGFRCLEDEEEDELDDEPMQAIQVAKVKKVAAELSSALKKEHVNIVFIGHVDAGKSTIGGRILWVVRILWWYGLYIGSTPDLGSMPLLRLAWQS